MFMPKLSLVVLAAISLAGFRAAETSPSASIRGVWQTVEVTVTGPGARTIVQSEPCLTIITAKHYSRVEVHTDRARPSVPDATQATADELRAAWGPFVAEAGTYEVSNGNVVTMRSLVAKDPAAMAARATSTYTFKLEGNTLWVTQQRGPRGPVPNPVTVKLTRVE